MPQSSNSSQSAHPERDRRYVSGELVIDSIELGQQITTKQAEAIIEELIEADRKFRRTPVKPPVYRTGMRRGD